LLAPHARAAEPLDAEKAFALRAIAVSADRVEIVFEIAPDYYLYGERFKFEATDGVTLGNAAIPPGVRKNDPFLGEVETYRGMLRIQLPISAPPETRRFTLTVTSQGCWDGGICYPPTPQRAEIDLPSLDTNSAPDGGNPPASGSGSGDESGRLAELLSSANALLALAIFFGLGLLLAFTPCVFPMIPILSSIIVKAGDAALPISRARALALSFAYVQGMALVYAVVGVVAGVSGSLLIAKVQSTWVPAVFALLFVLLALSMLGLFELRLPAALQERLTRAANRQKGGHLGGVAIMGALSALIVSPCVTAPLAGGFLYIAQTGDAVLGGAALYALALGMGTPLIIMAVAAHSLLPKAGAWMERIKKVIAILLLGVAAWMAAPLLPSSSSHGFEDIASEAELDEILRTANRPVMLDFYADWCTTCKQMERETFSDPAVAAKMAQLRLLRADVTHYNEAHKTLLARFGLIGPPGIVFFSADGKPIEGLRVVGFMPPAEFAALLGRVVP
jgi:thiol:disulfide interchange protein DsbD